MLRTSLLLGGIFGLALTSAALAQPQQQATPQQQIEFLQHAVSALQAQRNKAEDEVAQTTAQAQQLASELQKAQGEVKQLQAQLEKAKPAKEVPAPTAEQQKKKKK